MTRRVRIDVSLDGVTFTRAEEDAATPNESRRTHLDWRDVTGAVVHTTRKGRPVLRVGVAGVSPAEDHRDDPYAVKLPRRSFEAARELADLIEDEVAVRRRWQSHAGH